MARGTHGFSTRLRGDGSHSLSSHESGGSHAVKTTCGRGPTRSQIPGTGPVKDHMTT